MAMDWDKIIDQQIEFEKTTGKKVKYAEELAILIANDIMKKEEDK